MAANKSGDIKLLAIALLVAVLVLVTLVAVLLPATAPVLATMNDGMDIKEAVPWGFGLTVGLLAFFALVAGDGLIGELQFMLGSFLSLFLVLTLLIAWVF